MQGVQIGKEMQNPAGEKRKKGREREKETIIKDEGKGYDRQLWDCAKETPAKCNPHIPHPPVGVRELCGVRRRSVVFTSGMKPADPGMLTKHCS